MRFLEQEEAKTQGESLGPCAWLLSLGNSSQQDLGVVYREGSGLPEVQLGQASQLLLLEGELSRVGEGQALPGGFQAGAGTLCGDFLFPVLGLTTPSRPKMTLNIVRRAWGRGALSIRASLLRPKTQSLRLRDRQPVAQATQSPQPLVPAPPVLTFAP